MYVKCFVRQVFKLLYKVHNPVRFNHHLASSFGEFVLQLIILISRGIGLVPSVNIPKSLAGSIREFKFGWFN